MDMRAVPPPNMFGKTVILITHFIRGESEQQAWLLARELRRRHGVNAEVWSLSAYMHDPVFAQNFEAAGIPTKITGFKFPVEAPLKFMRGLQWLREIQRTAWQFRKCGVDVVLPFAVWPDVIAGLAYRLSGVRLCIWGEREAGIARVPTPERIAVRQVRHFAANSTAGVAFLVNEMRVAPECISLIPNGVEAPAGNKAVNWRSRLRLRPDETLVVKIGNVLAPKDHATLLRAWQIVQQQSSGKGKPFLALAGVRNYGAEYQECRQIIQQGDLYSTVRFLDSISDVHALIEASDLTVFSSRHEGMPNAILEYMVCGKPVVATDLPGVREALGPEAGDVVAPPLDAGQFAGKILQLLGNRQRSLALGEANRIRALSELTVERLADRYFELIRKNLPTRAAGRTAMAYSAR